MPSLKALRTRINSVKSTQKITSAMKMVAASKLRRAQTQAEAARPYAQRMERMLAALAASVAGSPTAPRMLVGTGKDQVHLLIPVTAERGLAGAFNTNIGRLTRNIARRLETEGKTVKILPVGRKGRDYLRRELASRIGDDISYAGLKPSGSRRRRMSRCASTRMVEAGEVDVVTVVYNRFHSVISQIPTEMQLVPHAAPGAQDEERRAEDNPAGRRRSTSSSRTRRPSSRGCCRRTSRSRSIARCWRTRPGSTARR